MIIQTPMNKSTLEVPCVLIKGEVCQINTTDGNLIIDKNMIDTDNNILSIIEKVGFNII